MNLETSVTLIMLDKPILVNNKKPELNDIVYNELNGNIYPIDIKYSKVNVDYERVIIAGHEGTKRLILNLSEEDDKKIGYVDVEKICNTFYGKFDVTDSDGNSIKELLKNGFIDGANKILSLVSRKYTNEDLKNALEIAQEEEYDEGGYLGLRYELREIIEKISQAKQYQVPYNAYIEIENQITVTKIL